jgi:nickel transport protein
MCVQRGIKMHQQLKRAIAVALLVVFSIPAWSHGAEVSATWTQQVQVRAVYESGHPMAQAQVTIFAPRDATQSWARGTTDDEGRFSFVPDPEQPGTWTVQVWHAGHGARVTVTTTPNFVQSDHAPVGSTTPWQKALMTVLVGWGALGTILFFRRRKGTLGASA